MVPPNVTVGFVGSSRIAQVVARHVSQRIEPRMKFCYKKQRLVSTLQAADPSHEHRKIFDALGFKTTEKNQDVIANCDVVFLGTNSREIFNFARDPKRQTRLRERLKNTLFVSLVRDLPAEQVEHLIYPGAKVIHMVPQSVYKREGLPQSVLPPNTWTAARNTHTSSDDVATVMEVTGISNCLQITDQDETLWQLSEAGLMPPMTTNPTTGRDLLNLDAGAGGGAGSGAGRTGDRFHDVFELGPRLGAGRFGVVYMGTQRTTGERCAVKCVENTAANHQAIDALKAEVAALRRLTHPHVVGHRGFYAEVEHSYLVLEYCGGGHVGHLLQPGIAVAEDLAKGILRQALSALAYCHAMDHVHRDIKAENLLLTTPPTHGRIPFVKLADFGMSHHLKKTHERLQSTCGTPQYLSPEIVMGHTYGKPSDIWSMGILAYMMLSGCIPFADARSKNELFRLIRLGAIWFNQPAWQCVSKPARHFVQRMLTMSPDSRATAEQLLEHPWLAQ